MYDSPHDADMRLTGTVIRYKKKPVMVRGVTIREVDSKGELCIFLDDTVSADLLPVSLNNPDLDISSPPLGWYPYSFRYGYSWAYASRLPERRQQQGIVPKRIILHECGELPTLLPYSGGLPELFACINADFCGLRDYEDLYPVMHRKCIVPFSRELAASYDRVFYRAHSIGKITHKKGKHIITIDSPSFKYYRLQEVFCGENWGIDW